MQTQYVVQKSLSTANGVLPPGTIIDPAGWRNLELLINQRYVRMVTEIDTQMQATAQPEPAKRGRKPKQKESECQTV